MVLVAPAPVPVPANDGNALTKSDADADAAVAAVPPLLLLLLLALAGKLRCCKALALTLRVARQSALLTQLMLFCSAGDDKYVCATNAMWRRVHGGKETCLRRHHEAA